MYKYILIIFILIYSLNTVVYAYGRGICVNFADGHSECISDVEKDSEIALALKKRASDSFKSSESSNTNKNGCTQESGDYLKRAKESAIDMLIQATQEYKLGKLSKDKFIEIAAQAGQMSDFANKNSNENSMSTPPTSSKDTNNDAKIADKILAVSALLPFGSPNIDNDSDDKLERLGNKQISVLREKFKELLNFQKNLGIKELNLKCASDSDCVYIPVGQKICGGPVSYLLTSKQDSNFSSISEKLKKFTSLDDEFQKMLHGYLGLCDFVVPVKATCQSICVLHRNKS